MFADPFRIQEYPDADAIVNAVVQTRSFMIVAVMTRTADVLIEQRFPGGHRLLWVPDRVVPPLRLAFAVARLPGLMKNDRRRKGHRRVVDRMNRVIAALWPLYSRMLRQYDSDMIFKPGGGGQSIVFTTRHFYRLFRFCVILLCVAVLSLALEIGFNRWRGSKKRIPDA